MIKLKKIATLGVAGLMLFSVIGFGISAPAYAQKPAEPGKSLESNGKKFQVNETIEGEETPTENTPAADNGLQNKPAVTPATQEKKVAVNTKEENGNGDKVTICHRTNSAKNPYVVITVDSNAVDGVANDKNDHADHFGEHKGPIASSFEVASKLKKDKIEWGDIIPPVAPHSGQNWTAEGQAILENGCNYATPETPDEDGDVLSETPEGGKGSILPTSLPNTGSDSPAFILMMIAAVAALAGLGGSIVRLVLSRKV